MQFLHMSADQIEHSFIKLNKDLRAPYMIYRTRSIMGTDSFFRLSDAYEKEGRLHISGIDQWQTYEAFVFDDTDTFMLEEKDGYLYLSTEKVAINV